MNIFIAAHYNLNNGDRAVLEATIQILKARYPKSHITVSAYKPELLKDDRFDTVDWPLKSSNKERLLLQLSRFKLFRRIYRKFYRIIVDNKYYESLMKSDIVFISGGHHLTDILGRIGYYKLALNFIPPIEMQKKVVLLPQSIGPALDKDVQDSIAYVLKQAKAVAYRDKASAEFIDSMECICNRYFVPDLVFNLNIEETVNNNKEVGIALYHVYNSENRDKMLSITMKGLSAIINDLLNQEYLVKIIPMDKGDKKFYDKLFETVRDNRNCNKFIMCQEKRNIMDLVKEFSGLDFVLAYKTHATVFSMICTTPLIAVAYHPKSIEFMESIGLKEYSIMDSDASYDNLKILVQSVQNNLTEIKNKELLGIENNRTEIIKFFEEIENEIFNYDNQNI